MRLYCPIDLSPLSENLECSYGHRYRYIEGIPDLTPPRFIESEKIIPFEKLYDRYDSRYVRHRVLFENELKAVKALGLNREKGIEIGVGTGRFAQALGINVGIDASINMLRLAKERIKYPIRALGELLPFKSSSFDHSLIAFTICFADKPDEIVREAIRVARENIVIAFVPRSSPRGQYYIKKDSPFYRVANFYDLDEVLKRLERRGDFEYTFYSTLFAEPGKEIPEEPKEGFYEDAGFLVVRAKKITRSSRLRTLFPLPFLGVRGYP